jgi:hypothetical protein
MPQVGFDPTIPVFERAKTVRAIDRVASVIALPNLKCRIQQLFMILLI